jgi:hypothetical protein
MPLLKFNKITVTVIVILALAIAAGSFYWFQFRPYKIYSDCSKEATEKALDYSLEEGDEEDKASAKKGRYYQEDYDVYYNRCLRNNGINAPDVK